MTILKNIEEINILREGGKILAFVLYEAAKKSVPGAKTIELDKLAEKMIKEAGGRPSFKNYKTPDDKFPYPASLCVSINEEVVHGVPGERVLKDGDIVSLDLGMEYKGFYTDSAVTVFVGNASEQEKWNLNLSEIARIWRGGCIIRSTLLPTLQKAYGSGKDMEKGLKEIHKHFEEEAQQSWRTVVAHGIAHGVPLPALSASLAFYDSMRAEHLPQNLIQAQRDFFGAHTYERIDKEGTFHTEWE